MQHPKLLSHSHLIGALDRLDLVEAQGFFHGFSDGERIAVAPVLNPLLQLATPNVLVLILILPVSCDPLDFRWQPPLEAMLEQVDSLCPELITIPGYLCNLDRAD